MTRFNPDDPKWTAYILGELGDSERAAVEAELESSEEARTLVDELRFAADLTKLEMRDHATILPLTAQQRETIRAAAGSAATIERPRRWFGVPPIAWAAGLAAASIALVIAITPEFFVEHKRAMSAPPPAPVAAVAQQESAKAEESRIAAPEFADKVSPVEKTQRRAEPSAGAPAAPAADAAKKTDMALVDVKAPLPAGKVFGTINDASKARIQGVTVAATNTQTGTVATAVTNEAGVYALDGLQPGPYQIKAELPGFQTAIANGAQVSPGQREEVDLTLQVAQNAEAVVVTATSAATPLQAEVRQQSPNEQQKQGIVNAAPQSFVAPAPAPPPAPSVANNRTANLEVMSSTFDRARDTSGYANIRRYLNQNQLPPPDAVRIDDLVNHFTYDYPQPSGRNLVGVTFEAAAAPWNPQHRLVRIGIRTKSAARGVKFLAVFNPMVVETYQRIGEDSNNKLRDARDMVSGQTTTVLYEVVPRVPPGKDSQEMLKVDISYMESNDPGNKSLSFSLTYHGQPFARASTDFRFAAAVASFGMILRDSSYKGSATFDSTLAIVRDNMGSDLNGDRHEFMRFVQRARQLRGR
jgi:hypothetical protein